MSLSRELKRWKSKFHGVTKEINGWLDKIEDVLDDVGPILMAAGLTKYIPFIGTALAVIESAEKIGDLLGWSGTEKRANASATLASAVGETVDEARLELPAADKTIELLIAEAKKKAG